MFKKILISSYLLSCSALAGTSFTYDGHYDASEYDKTFAITYSYEGRDIEGGTLAITTYNNQQYIYISHPLAFKDLSYGTNEYSVGWQNIEHGAKNLEKAIGSEFMELKLTTNNTSGDGSATSYSVNFNPKFSESKSTINGVGKGAGKGTATSDNKVGISFISTNDYNSALYNGWGNLTTVQQEELYAIRKANLSTGGTRTIDLGGGQVSKTWNQYFNGDLDIFESHSPLTKAPALIDDCIDETSSDPSCYVIVADMDGSTDINENVYGWDFNWGLEIKLNLKGTQDLFFGDLASITEDTFGYKVGDAVIRLDALHASDPKLQEDTHHTTYVCDKLDDGNGGKVGIDSKHEPCGATVVSIPPTEVPEPSTLAIFALALGLLRFQAKRRNT